jgi:asparagine synthase (glutamine-hydrolysing)
MCGLVFYEGPQTDLKDFGNVLGKMQHRGPDNTRIISEAHYTFAFHRLAIMDLSHHGDQPFTDEVGNRVVCNGEIYNFLEIRNKLNFQFDSHSDCEVILPLYQQGVEKLLSTIDGEYAFVIWDHHKNTMIAARDPMGIRPLFYGAHKLTKKMMFASEVKVLHPYCDEIKPFPPGFYYENGKFICFHDHAQRKPYLTQPREVIYSHIHDLLYRAIEKRLNADTPIGFLLSGGLDSSLVCGISAKIMKKPLITFSIGMDKDPIDLKYAKEVAQYIGSDHHEVIMNKEQVLGAVEKVIFHLETWDITTIRASIGMYLVCKYIREKTNVRAVLTGEVSDELFGYKYTDFAPSAEEFQKEAEKRVRELYIYDVLRADRCIAGNSLEARVPFSDRDFVDYVMKIDPEIKLNKYKMGKFILREPFKDKKYIPDSILWRDKAAFSDAVGHSMVDYLKAEAEKNYSDQDLANAAKKYPHGTPFTKESLWYRDIFESLYPGRGLLIKDFWMPNKTWPGCQVNDPSARVLTNYGASGV